MPLQGDGVVRSVRIGSDLVEDVVWYYPEPTPDTAGIRDHLCFFNEKVDLEVDGEAQTRPQTQWS